jgi:hypothetical protein
MASLEFSESAPASTGTRNVRVVSDRIQAGQTNTVIVKLQAVGDEAGLGFSLTFDPARLSLSGGTNGSATTNAAFNLNTNFAASGRVGIALALPAGARFTAGDHELARLNFRVSNTGTGDTLIAFSDQPVFRELSDSFGNALQVSWLEGALTVGPKGLRLGIAQQSPNGAVGLLVSGLDGSFIESHWASRIGIAATTNLAMPLASWPLLTNPLIWSNGTLRIEDSPSQSVPRRFYNAVEQR